MDGGSKALVAAELQALAGDAMRPIVPALIADAGHQVSRRFLEFFAATIRNKNTRQVYYHAITRFFAWCDQHKIGELADIEPLHVAVYFETLGKDLRSRP